MKFMKFYSIEKFYYFYQNCLKTCEDIDQYLIIMKYHLSTIKVFISKDWMIYLCGCVCGWTVYVYLRIHMCIQIKVQLYMHTCSFPNIKNKNKKLFPIKF